MKICSRFTDSAFLLKMHFFLEGSFSFLSFFSGSMLCRRLTTGPVVAAAAGAQGVAWSTFLWGMIPTFFTLPMRVIIVSDPLSDITKKRREPFDQKESIGMHLPLSLFPFKNVRGRSQKICRSKRRPDNLISLWSSMILIPRYFKHFQTYLWCLGKLTLKTNDGTSVRKCTEDFH